MKLDLIIPLKSNLLSLAINNTIPSLIKNISFNNIYIVTKKDNFEAIKNALGNTVICLDENKILDGLILNNIQEYFKKRNVDYNRAGWYFQQFLKLSISKLNFITNLYLVWDADAVALKPIQFISKDDKVFLEKTKEHHKPYFITLEKLIGLKKQVNFSFIAEYLVFDKEIVKEMLLKISKNKNWWFDVLDKIDSVNLEKSGFSEYETYGNYVSKFYKERFIIRNLNKTRKGVRFLGKQPSEKGLKLFSYVYDYMSFEQWHKKYTPLPIRVVAIFFSLFIGIIKKSKSSSKTLISF
ncbi:hypothetical protein JL193_15545 [Polaribacter batillariae]|uniref:Uncharacterized protein n=1 Tax=Polaribacter batillariae TaxID=2808900 RepID=A0ABX7ST95_9FLAO|nr:DUF6492 family protein [Polaribacter batillariae]QTD37472.1 hypothetical protein JL193_15545 [Polaribacter batillariae]